MSTTIYVLIGDDGRCAKEDGMEDVNGIPCGVRRLNFSVAKNHLNQIAAQRWQISASRRRMPSKKWQHVIELVKNRATPVQV